MLRTEKHKLERVLIELDNAVHDLILYIQGKRFIEKHSDPMEQVESWFGLKELK